MWRHDSVVKQVVNIAEENGYTNHDNDQCNEYDQHNTEGGTGRDAAVRKEHLPKQYRTNDSQNSRERREHDEKYQIDPVSAKEHDLICTILGKSFLVSFKRGARVEIRENFHRSSVSY